MMLSSSAMSLPDDSHIPDMPTEAELQFDFDDGLEDETVLNAGTAVQILENRLSVLQGYFKIVSDRFARTATPLDEQQLITLGARIRDTNAKLIAYKRLHDGRN